MNEQREVIYKERRQVLDGESMREPVFSMIGDIVENAVDTCIRDDMDQEEWDLGELNQLILPIIPIRPITRDNITASGREALKQDLKTEATKLYESIEAAFDKEGQLEMLRERERVVLLRVVDSKWMNHIDDMEQLRQGIGMQALGQHDPLVEYKIAGYDMFNEMTTNIMQDTVRILYQSRPEQKVEERKEVVKVTGTNKDDTLQKKPQKRADKKIYPNDPCPCGSGKKYKNCHGRMKA